MKTDKIDGILKKVDDFVIMKTTQESTEIVIRDNAVDEGSITETESFNIKFWKGMRTASAELDSLDPTQVRRLFAKLSSAPKIKYFHGLPEKETIPKMKSYDPKLAKMSIPSIVRDAESLRDATVASNVNASYGVLQRVISETEILTSRKVSSRYRYTVFSAAMSATAEMNGSKATAWHSEDSRKYFKSGSIGTMARRKAKDQLTQVKASSFPKTIVLLPSALSQLIHYCLLPNLKISSAEAKRSLYEKKIGETIWASHIRLRDDPVKAWGTSSYPLDYEGSAAKITNIVKDGRLMRFVSDYNTAMEMKMPRTPNADMKGISFSNVILDGKRGQVKNAIFVGDLIGAHTAERFTTRFSVMADNAYILKAGKKTPIKPFQLSGSLDNIFKQECFFTGKLENHGSIYTRGLATKHLSVVR